MRPRWLDRSFRFDTAPEAFDALLDQLRVAPSMAEGLVSVVAPEIAAARPEGQWSILDQIGHLADLDELHLTRVQELARGTERLAAADMSNRATWDADWHRRPAADVLGSFAARRSELVGALAALAPAARVRAAMHPRLLRPMRGVDLVAFAVTHDGHHLATAADLATRAALAPAPASETLPGPRVRQVARGVRTLRLLTMSAGFAEATWCSRRHDAFVLDGVLELELPIGALAVAAGSVARVAARHRAAAPRGAVVASVDDVTDSDDGPAPGRSP